MMELSPRLLAASEMCGTGYTLCDVGSDHGYLPLYLLENGKFKRAIVTDINKGPLSSAVHNFENGGFANKASFVLCDGLRDVVVDKTGDFVVSICGMGGELIASILDGRRDMHTGIKRFVFQPMTKADVLRRYLWDNGFVICAERAVREGEKSYVLFEAYFSGEKIQYDGFDALCGKKENRTVDNNMIFHFEKMRDTIKTIADGKGSAGLDIAAEIKMIDYIDNEVNAMKEMIL